VKPLLLAAAAKASAALKAPVATVTTAPVTPVVPQQAPAAPAAMQLTWMQAHAAWLTHSLAAIGVIAAVLLIVLLAVQTTKQEGLSGTIGGRVESTYRGRPGAEEQLKRITGVVVGVWLIAYLVLSISGI
jgi:protein translocase SecG subunit